MAYNKEVAHWLNDNLSDILSFPVPQDLTEYILTIENDRDIEEYLTTLLDLNNPRHRSFIEKYKIIRHTNDTTEENKRQLKGDYKKKQKSNGASKKDKNINNYNEESEVKGGVRSKKKNRFVNLYSSEGENKDVILLKGRHLCECQASKHRLINNCLRCGRIVCAQEGSGPCLFCGTLVCIPEEENIINANTKQSKKLYDLLMNTTKSEDLERALTQRNRLVEFDKTVQQRSKVIDDESDYYSSSSSWLTKEERDQIQKREERAHAKKHASRLARKVTLDFAERQVIEEIGSEEEDGEEFYKDSLSKIQETLAESHAHPDFTENIQPVFVSERQYDEIVLENEIMPTKNINYRVQDKELLLISDNGACMSLHQPWASLLVCGVKRHEGRTWYTSHRGRLWIASTSKTPTEESIKECENFYRMFIGDININFPTSYPTSCLLGCVSVVDCLPQEEYRAKYPEGESESPFVFICEDPLQLDIRFPVSGSQKIYKLDHRIHQAAKKILLRIAKQAKCEK